MHSIPAACTVVQNQAGPRGQESSIDFYSPQFKSDIDLHFEREGWTLNLENFKAA
jgi:hypothetical protein